MKQIHIVIPDLFLPQPLAKEVCAGLALPVLEKALVRGKAQTLTVHTLEDWLCQAYAVADSAIAPVTLLADGLQPEGYYWLRADPVHLRLERDQTILQTNVAPDQQQATQLCAQLNRHFSGDGLTFFAPHPRRWYLRLAEDPQLRTHSVYQVEGRDARRYMPQGEQALRWHGLLNEMQMLLYGQSVQQVTTDSVPVNSLWLWGGGHAAGLSRPFAEVHGDSPLAAGFSQASIRQGVAHSQTETVLYVWEALSVAVRRGDYYAWREALLRFEQELLVPLVQRLAAGEVRRIWLTVLQEEGSRSYELTRNRLWQVWKRPRALASFAVV